MTSPEYSSSSEQMRANQRSKIKSALEKFCKYDQSLHQNGIASILINTSPKQNPLEMMATKYEKRVWDSVHSEGGRPMLQYQTPADLHILEVEQLINKSLQAEFLSLMKELDARMKKLDSLTPPDIVDQVGTKQERLLKLLSVWNKHNNFDIIDMQCFENEIKLEVDSKEDFKSRLRRLFDKIKDMPIQPNKQKMIRDVSAKFKLGFQDILKTARTAENKTPKQAKFPQNPWLPTKPNNPMDLADVLVDEDQRLAVYAKVEALQKELNMQICFWKDELKIQTLRQRGNTKEIEEERRPAAIFGFACRKSTQTQDPRVWSHIPRLAKTD